MAVSKPNFLARRVMAPHASLMTNDNGPVIDMTPDGQFSQARPFGPQMRGNLSLASIAVRLAAGLLLIGMAVAIFWITIFTLPLIFLGGIILYGVYRFQLMRHGGKPFGAHHGGSTFTATRR